jgi:anti-sigma regulatory factor (Ser/Thr protein kinase)
MRLFTSVSRKRVGPGGAPHALPGPPLGERQRIGLSGPDLVQTEVVGARDAVAETGHGVAGGLNGETTSIRIRGGPGAPSHARTAVVPELVGQLPEARVLDATLLVSELVTNSVVHAQLGPESSLTVELTRIGNRLRIAVSDPGSQVIPHLRVPYEESPGGFGLMLVDKLSAGWGVTRSRGSTACVWCELEVEPPG